MQEPGEGRFVQIIDRLEARRRRGSVQLALTALVLGAAAVPAAAEEAMPSFAPRETGTAVRPAGISLLSFAPQPRTTQGAEAGVSPLDITPSKEGIAAALAAIPKPAKVPLPPRVERPRGATAAAEPAKATPPAATAPAPAVQTAKAAPAPGFFSWLARQNEDAVVTSREEVASLSPVVRTAKLDLSDPFNPRRLPDSSADDDLEDEETKKLVEKQVPAVEISCFKPRLLRLIHAAGAHFKGTPIVTSGFRSRGRRGSYHRKCEAADFFITGVASGQLTAFLRTVPGAGGVGTYCHTKSVHIDTGEPRDWHQCGFRRRFALREPVLAAQIGSR